jgi:hypothetical protein
MTAWAGGKLLPYGLWAFLAKVIRGRLAKVSPTRGVRDVQSEPREDDIEIIPTTV